MKYAFITAALAAASFATTVNVEVEGTEISTENNRNHHHLTRHHRNHGNDRHWWTGLWNRGGRHQNEDRHGRGRGRNDRNDRDRSRDRSRSRDRDGRGRRYEANDIIEDLFSSNYECILDARGNRDRKEDTRRCCEEQLGGTLLDERGHCVLRDVMRNPRDDWRNCALEQRGAEWAECYRREAREIEDRLDGRVPGEHDDQYSNGRRRNRNDRGRNGRGRNDRNRDDRHRDNDRKRHGRHGNRNHDNEQSVLGNSHHGHDRQQNFECRIELDDQMRREQIARQCCEEQRLGHYNPEEQTCRIDDREDKEDFQQCAIEQGAQDIECFRD